MSSPPPPSVGGVEVRRAVEADVGAAAAVLGAAFADYPWTRWTVDHDNHIDRLTQLQRLALQHYGLPYGQVWLAESDGVIGTVAVWMDSAVDVPEHVHASIADITARLEGSRHAASVAAERETAGWKPLERHCTLGAIGTEPSLQRRGLAGAVLRPGLLAADDEQLPAFLETSSTGNVSFYQSFGFEVVGHRAISGGGPEVWAMLRPPSKR